MAERTFREEPAGWNCSRAADLHYGFGGRGWRAKRRRLRARNSIERFEDRVLWGNSLRRSHHGSIFWAADGERLCWRVSARSILSVHAGRNLSACAGVDDVRPTIGLDFANSR